MDADTINCIVNAITQPKIVELDNEHQIVLLPEGFTVQDISKNLPPPDRIVQKVTMQTPEELCAYVLAYAGSGETTTVFCDEPNVKFEGVLDYHEGDGTSGRCDHIATYTCPLSTQWTLWRKSNATKMSQNDFARFIEDNRPDIFDPPAADMLQIALSLQVHKSAQFKSDIRLDNGQRQLGYVEEVNGATKAGNLAIPEIFTLNIPIFIDAPPVKVDARLRYRMTEGQLTMWYDLVRPEDVLATAVKTVTEKVRSAVMAKAASAKVLLGRRG